jgi:hypothetical protein
MLRIPHYLDSWLIGGSKVVSFTLLPLLTPGNIFRYSISLGNRLHPRAVVWLEGLATLKKMLTTSLGLKPQFMTSAVMYTTAFYFIQMSEFFSLMSSLQHINHSSRMLMLLVFYVSFVLMFRIITCASDLLP